MGWHDGGGIDWLRPGKEPRKVDVFQAKDGLFEDAVHLIVEDDFGYLWASSNQGVFRVKKSELDAFAAGETHSFRSFSFGKADGMKNPECNSGTPGGMKARDGRMWFPTMQGVVAFEPARLTETSQVPPVIVEEFLVNRAPVTLAEKKESRSARTAATSSSTSPR